MFGGPPSRSLTVNGYLACGKTITPPHVKRHIATHADVSREDSDIAWVRWLQAREEIAAENADRMARDHRGADFVTPEGRPVIALGVPSCG